MKFLIFLLSCLCTTSLWACPMCGGELDGASDRGYYVYILAGFILLTYIPFYILYKTIYKYRNLNKLPSKNHENTHKTAHEV